MSPGSWRTVVHYMPVATMTVVPFRAPMPAARLHHGGPGRGPAAHHPAVPHVLHHPLVVSSHPFLELAAAVCGKHRHEPRAAGSGLALARPLSSVAGFGQAQRRRF
jgi:hypothetical protein